MGEDQRLLALTEKLATSDEKLKNWAAALQSLVVALGLVVGGVWAWYTFIAESTVDIKNATIAQLQRQLSIGAVIDITIKPQQLEVASGETRFVSVEVGIQNRGNKSVRMDFRKVAPLAVAHMFVDDDGRKSYGPVQYEDAVVSHPEKKKIAIMDELVLFPSAAKKYSFLLALKKPGFYYIAFATSTTDAGERTQSDRADFWTGDAFFHVM